MPDPRVLTVEIAGQRYPIRSSLDASYVTDLAAYVERKMQLVAESAPTSDVLGLAILVALNLADEVFRSTAHRDTSSETLNDRALRLERILDDALAQLPAVQAFAAP